MRRVSLQRVFEVLELVVFLAAATTLLAVGRDYPNVAIASFLVIAVIAARNALRGAL